MVFAGQVKGSTIPGFTRGSTLHGWFIESQNGGGQCSISDDGTIRLSTGGGRTVCPCVGLARDVAPVTDFNFSLQVRANQPESFLMSLDDDAGHEVSLKFGHYAAPYFIFGGSAHPNYTIIAVGNEQPEWYTMKLSVYKDPFTVRAEVWDSKGTSLGNHSYSDLYDMSFESITSFRFFVWGYEPSDYSVRNIIDPFVAPTLLSISTNSLSTQAGSTVNIVGTLTDLDGTPLQNRSIVLYDTFPGGNGWIPIVSDTTSENGEYVFQWINSAAGSFTLKVEYDGENSYDGVSNTTTLSFLPYESQQVFIVESNSTVSELAFNTTSEELSFTVKGDLGTTGFVKATIARNLISNGADVKVYLDGNQLNYTLTQTDESWILLFEYSHSTHDVAVYMGTNLPSQTITPAPSPNPTQSPNHSTSPSTPSQPTQSPSPIGFLGMRLPVEYGYAVVAVLVIIIVGTSLLVYFKKRNSTSSQN